jgi:hypothetical protein
MSCSALYYLEWNSRLNGRFFATQNHKKMRENILLLTLEAGATNSQHLLFQTAKERCIFYFVAPASMC